MDSQETPINRCEQRRSRRSAVAERISLWFEEWVRWRGGDALRAIFGLIRRPFEWAAWALRRGVIWPLQDHAGAVIAAIAAVLAVAVGVAALLGSTSSDSSGEPVSNSNQVAAAPEPPVVATPKEAKKDPQPTLQGATPVFEPAKQEKDTAAKAAQPTATAPTNSDPATATIDSVPGAATSSAATSAQSSIGVDGPPAGPEAIAVAKDFAGAFLLYETGGEESQVRKVFATTATPELAKSLLRRPPRLPANVEVPKAKVVNVVAGPSHGGVYTVSVSLLRVGLTSELRLDMEKLKKDWRVTNVLG
jgi:hypothetical protein